MKWDLIILDEGQRIKNWEAKTSQVIKALKSPFALVLSGTPLENRLDELYSVVEFIDDRRLGPAFRFYNRYRIVDEKGKVLGYKNLDDLRERLKPVLLRRTRKMVMPELPPRTTEIRRIPPTDEQLICHNAQMRIIKTIISKKYISEMDLLRLQKALLICRMAANSTFLVDKVPPGYSSKLVEFENLLDQLIEEEDRKIVLFSEWTTMLSLIEPLLRKRKVRICEAGWLHPPEKKAGVDPPVSKKPGRASFLLRQTPGPRGLISRQPIPSSTLTFLGIRRSLSKGSPAFTGWDRRGLSRPFSSSQKRLWKKGFWELFQPSTIWPWRPSTLIPE